MRGLKSLFKLLQEGVFLLLAAALIWAACFWFGIVSLTLPISFKDVDIPSAVKATPALTMRDTSSGTGSVKFKVVGEDLSLNANVETPSLHQDILTAFQSNAKSGCTKLGASGKVQTKWCHMGRVHYLHVINMHGDFKADVKIRIQALKSNQDLRASPAISFDLQPVSEGLLMKFAALQMDGLPGDLAGKIVEDMDDVPIPLPPCWLTLDLSKVTTSYDPAISPQLKMSGSIPKSQALSVATCLLGL